MQFGRMILKLRQENGSRKLRNETVNDTGEKEDKEQGKKRVKAKQRMACFSEEKQNEDVISTNLFKTRHDTTPN